MKTYILFLLLLMCSQVVAQSTTITPGDNTANVYANASNRGIQLPLMTTAQRDNLASPVNGLMIFNTSINCVEFYQNNSWKSLCKKEPPPKGVFNKMFGSYVSDIGNSIQQTKDGGYILAGMTSAPSPPYRGDIQGESRGNYDAWIVKLDPFCQISWSKLLGGSDYDSYPSIKQTKDGGYIVGMTTMSNISGDITAFNHGASDFCIFKLDALGSIVWNKLLGGDAIEVFSEIIETNDGGYLAIGETNSSANGDVSGVNHGIGFADYWIVKMDILGNIMWNRIIGGSNNDRAKDVIQTADGNYVVAGITSSSNSGDVTDTNHGYDDCWIVKLDGNGNIIWQRLYGSADREELSEIRETTDGGFIVAASTSGSANGDVIGTNHGNYDYWAIKLNANGNMVWNKLYGGDGSDHATSLQVTADNGFIMVGESSSSANGDVTEHNHSWSFFYDLWIVRLDASGNILWNRLIGGGRPENAVDIRKTSDGGYIIFGSADSENIDGNVTQNKASADYWIVKINDSGN